jgi:hypothetical protein
MINHRTIVYEPMATPAKKRTYRGTKKTFTAKAEKIEWLEAALIALEKKERRDRG